MFFVYNFVVVTAGFVLEIIALFSRKMHLFVAGRRNVLRILNQQIDASDKTIWLHAASLGEYEQGLPVMEKIKVKFPGHKLILTFFSPSGFEVRKNNTIADITVYLPLDTMQNSTAFIEAIHPEMVFFVKYEYWPNYLNELKNRQVPTYLISGIFREDQLFFKWYGGFYRKALDAFTHFFVQNSPSKSLLLKLGKANVTVSGDTRFDRVAAILERDNSLKFMDEFKDNALVIVIGSSWPKDESLLVEFMNSTKHAVKFVIAPHNIKPEQVSALQNSISKKTVLFSELENKVLFDYDVLIVDTIGILTKIYSYADIAYVGGGFGNPGVHNILEPAAFGIPIVIGPNYSHFAEATALVGMNGCISVSSQSEMDEAFENLICNRDVRVEIGHICGTFVQMNKNASDIIMKQITDDADV